MPHGGHPLSYTEYLALVKQQESGDRERYSTADARRRPPAEPGHPFDGALPPTGNAEYDSYRPYEQVSRNSTRAAAGFDIGDLERYRRMLEQNPYGPRHHIVEPNGTIRPARED